MNLRAVTSLPSVLAHTAATIKLLRTRNTQRNYFRRLKSDAVRDIVRDRRLTRTYYESTSRFIRIIYLIPNDDS